MSFFRNGKPTLFARPKAKKHDICISVADVNGADTGKIC